MLDVQSVFVVQPPIQSLRKQKADRFVRRLQPDLVFIAADVKEHHHYTGSVIRFVFLR